MIVGCGESRMDVEWSSILGLLLGPTTIWVFPPASGGFRLRRKCRMIKPMASITMAVPMPLKNHSLLLVSHSVQFCNKLKAASFVWCQRNFAAKLELLAYS
jgi:hypothetical protein